MIYILETNLSNTKNVYIALKKIFGINNSKSKLICKKIGLSDNISFNELTKKQIKRLSYFVETSGIRINTDLKYIKRMERQKSIEIRTIKGIKNLSTVYKNKTTNR